MKKKLFLSILALLLSISSQSETLAEKQAQSFMSIYSQFCLNYLNRFSQLRQELKNFPQLPPQKAEAFLHGKKGQAWSIPDKYGLFVLTLFDNQEFCAVFGREVDTHKLQTLFKDFLKDAPPPLISKEMPKKENKNTNEPTESIAYLWGIKDKPLQMHFMLTTSKHSKTLQAFASATRIKK